MYVCVCLRMGALGGWGGALKQAPCCYHGNMSLWSFCPPSFFFFFFFLQLDITTRSALFSSQLLSPRSPLSHSHSYCSIKIFSLWRLKPIPSQTQCYFWLYSRLRLWLCAVQFLTCECAKDGKKKEKEKKEKKDKHDSVCWCKRENPEERDVWMCAEQQTKTNSLITKLPAGQDR